MSFALFLLLACQAAGPVETRIVERTVNTSTRETEGAWRAAYEINGDALRVHAWREHECHEETVETRVVESFRQRDVPVAEAAALGGVAIVGLGAAGVGAALAPAQPSLNDEFSRGELSREGAFALAATAGVLGAVAAVGAVASVMFVSDEVVDRNNEKVVVASRRIAPCENASLREFHAELRSWTGVATNADTVDAAVEFSVAEALDDVAPRGQSWAQVDVSQHGEVLTTIAVEPSVTSILTALEAHPSAENLERFRDRFATTAAWEFLGTRFEALAARHADAQKEAQAAQEEQRDAHAASLLAQARAAAKAGDIGVAKRLLQQASDEGRIDNALRERIDALAVARGRALLKRALTLAQANDVAGATSLAAEATALGVDTIDGVDDAIAAAMKRVAERHRANAIRLAKQGKLKQGEAELSEAQRLGVSTDGYVDAVHAGLSTLAEGPCGITADALDRLLTNDYFQQLWVVHAKNLVSDASVGRLMAISAARARSFLSGSQALDDWNISPTLRRQAFKSRMRSIAEFVGTYDKELGEAMAHGVDIGALEPRLLRRGLGLSKTFSDERVADSFLRCAKLLDES